MSWERYAQLRKNSDGKFWDNHWCYVITTGTIIEHDCQIGFFTNIAVSGAICGGYKIGDSAFVGANITIIQGGKMSMNSINEAGSIVLSNVPKNNMVIGTFRGGGGKNKQFDFIHPFP